MAMSIEELPAIELDTNDFARIRQAVGDRLFLFALDNEAGTLDVETLAPEKANTVGQLAYLIETVGLGATRRDAPRGHQLGTIQFTVEPAEDPIARLCLRHRAESFVEASTFRDALFNLALRSYPHMLIAAHINKQDQFHFGPTPMPTGTTPNHSGSSRS